MTPVFEREMTVHDLDGEATVIGIDDNGVENVAIRLIFYYMRN
jgi:hypothetical protein